MPQFCTKTIIDTGLLRVQRIDCDGVDPLRARSESLEGDRIIIVLDGQFSFRNRSGRVAVSPGAALMIPAEDEFEIKHPKGRGDTCYSIRSELISLEHLRAGLARNIGTWDFVALVHSINSLVQECTGTLELEEALSSIFGGEHPREHDDDNCDLQIADAVKYCVNLHLADSLTIREIAAATGTSMFHACRAFRRATGRTIHGYQRELRLNHSISLMLATEYSLTEIAYRAGFANVGHFGNCFRQRFGTCPSDFRTRIQQAENLVELRSLNLVY